MKRKNLILSTVVLSTTLMLGACSSEESDSLYTVNYLPSLVSSFGISSGNPEDIAIVVGKLADLLNHNGFTTTSFGSSLYVNPQDYTKSDVAVRDTAAVRQELMAKALSDYKKYIDNIKNNSLKSDPELKNLLASYDNTINMAFGRDTLVLELVLLCPIIEGTTWTCSDTESPIQSISFNDGLKCDIVASGENFSDLSYYRSNSSIRREDDTPSFRMGFVTATQLRLIKFNDGEKIKFDFSKSE